jgi:hypothetical protein
MQPIYACRDYNRPFRLLTTAFFPFPVVSRGARALLLFGLLMCAALLQAQTTWMGTVSTDWSVPGNWSAGVPTASTDAVIPDVTNDPVITGGTAALAKSVHVQTSAALTINAMGSLTINGSATFGIFTAGFYNEGTVSNSGNLTIGSTAAVGTRGIVNDATFNNNNGGEISIDRSTAAGLHNVYGTFTNAAKITIGAVAPVGSRGIINQNIFNNNSGGEISIDRSSINGLDNVGTFTNAAKITIGAVGAVGTEGIKSGFRSIFNNSTCTALVRIV